MYTKVFSLLIGSLILVNLAVCDTDISAVMPDGSPVSPSVPVPSSADLASEARQLPGAAATGGSSGPVYPYNVYQNQPYAGYNTAPQQPASSGGSMLNFWKPQGGRRSFTSRIKNLMSSLFRRDTASYPAAGSSYSYAFRQPPYGFSPSMGSMNSALNPSYSGYDANPSYLGGSSGYQSAVFQQYPSSGASGSTDWSNYKQWASSVDQPSSFNGMVSSGPSNSGKPAGTNYAWSSASGPSSGVPSGSSSSYGSSYNSDLGSVSSSDLGSYSQGSAQNSGSGVGSESMYQASASNTFPSTSYSTSYHQQQATGQQPNVSYKRSSTSSSFKPVAGSTYTSGKMAPSSSVSSSSSYGSSS